ncbi:MAG: peptidoglycan-binding protein [Reyranella sp.]|uniref:peptidoglycan-binding domain-containing protein n=1 Tax=Reyranella sp. TaxID=1929291 RepID=UPI00120819EB|nr:hypothetical protein [Reyranella sp.]TAJ40224.1 MAG: peptidoglycan-binding protein [Reyranella sp.]
MISARSCLAACAALSLSACGARDQLDPGAVSVKGVQPTLEQLNITSNSQAQIGLVNHLANEAGYNWKDLQAVDARWGQVFEAGVYEVGRQCDQYLDALFRFNREQRANRQGLTAIGAGAAAIMGLSGVASAAIAITAVAFGLATNLFDAGVNSVLFTIEPSALRNIVQKGREAYLDKLVKDKVEINTRPRMMIAVQGYLVQCSPAAIEANINNAASGAPSVASADPKIAQQAAGLSAPSLSTMTKAAAIVGGTVAPGAPLPDSALPAGAVKGETPVIPELQEAQRALGVPVDGRYGPVTRAAIREFQAGMFRRDPSTWPASEITGNLTSRAGRTLPALKPMPKVFMSPFERAFLGNDSGFLSANPLSDIDPRVLDSTLSFLGATPDQVTAASGLDARIALLRARITKLREDFKLPMDKGAILDAALYKAVWRDSPMNVHKTD